MLFIAWMGYELFFSDHGYRVYLAEKAEVARLSGELDALRLKRERLAKGILRLRNDPKALEALVHRELGYVHSDEYMLIMPKVKAEKGAGEKVNE